MRRRKIRNKRRAARSFRRQTGRVKGANLRPPVMRGGIRF